MLVPVNIVRSMLLLGVVVAIATIWIGALQSATGVALVERAGTVVALIDGKALGPVSLEQGGRSVRILPIDIEKDSDKFDSATALNLFYRRQTLLSAMSRAPDARLRVAGQKFPIVARRGVSGNPPGFWLILLPGVLGLAVSAVVLAAGPKSLANRLVALTGLMFPFVTAGSAITITRGLAVDGELIRWLMFVHEISAVPFAVVMA
ncbi:MAG: hypothetical protein EOP58_11675, partial [Sphingomonadales bacterium]